MNPDELRKLIGEDEFGLLDVKPKACNHCTADERLVNSFEEINDFFDKTGHEPQDSDDILEKKLYFRLNNLREDACKKEALAQYDENGDGIINKNDSVFSSLKLWQDKNSDGITDAYELTSKIINESIIPNLQQYKGFNKLDTNMKAALIDAVYGLGPAGFSKSTNLIKLIANNAPKEELLKEMN